MASHFESIAPDSPAQAPPAAQAALIRAPWTYSVDSFAEVYDSDGANIATVWGDYDAEPGRSVEAKQLASADLIIAAPDLLAALEAMRDAEQFRRMCGRHNCRGCDWSIDQAVKLADVAIAKARGEAAP